MNIKAEEYIEKNLEAILPHLLEINADNQVGKYLFILHLHVIYTQRFLFDPC